MTEYRIDELAREAGTTVRNVRAYQDRGLISPPRREGRVGMYTDAHLSRLRIIGQLLDRGYSLANIAELIGALERGHDLGELVGLGAALTTPWSDEAPTYISAQELFALFGGENAETLADAIKLGFVEPEGDRFRVPSPRLLHAGAELFAAGIPLEAIMGVARALRRDVDRIAGKFVELTATHLFDPYGDALPPPEDVPRLAELVRRLRPLAQMAVDAELARAMERHVQSHLGRHLEQLTKHLEGRDAS
ncbi:MAG: MerR family transcriptional regulator [Actinobacteria bacterium]|nr:MAG: MerR family transcriptional regulator [Actinomycetota bacterium]